MLCAGGVLPYLSLCKDSCSWRHSHRAGWGKAELKHHSCTSCLFGPVVDEVGPSGCCAVDRCCPKMDNIVCETEWRLDSPPLARNGVLPTRGTGVQLRTTQENRQAGETKPPHSCCLTWPDPFYQPLHNPCATVGVRGWQHLTAGVYHKLHCLRVVLV